MCECEDGPVVGDGTEFGVLCVRKHAVADELGAYNDVLAGLIGEAVRLRARDGESMTVSVTEVNARLGYHSMRNPLEQQPLASGAPITYQHELTLNVVADLGENCLLLELYFMEDKVSGRSRPVDRETVVPGDPFGADVRVNGDGVGVAIIGGRRHCQVREWNGLVEQIARLRGGECAAYGGLWTTIPRRGLGT